MKKLYAEQEFYENHDWNKFWEGQLENKSLKDKIFVFGRKYFTKKYVNQLSKIMNVTGMKCIEVGAGLGECSLALKEKGAIVHVLDKVDTLIPYWKKLKLFNYTIADAKKISLEDGLFDLVWNAGVLEHFENAQEILLEMKRICIEKGIVCIFVPYMFDWTSHLQLYGKEIIYNKKLLKNLFEDCGFKNVSTKVMWSLGGMSICGWAKK